MLAIQAPEVYKEKLLQRPAIMTTSILKEPLGLRYNGAALLYVVVAYVTGLAGLFHPSWAIKVAAVLLLTHSMIIAAYLIHDCGHQLVFKRSRDNARLGRAMSWVRGAVFVTLLILFPIVATLYVLAYLLMMHVLRFMDALQHDYPYSATLFNYVQPPHKGDNDWEQEHTFSVPISLRFPSLNWLTLNFGYHNAHHHNMNVPWYRLPALHKEMTDNDPASVIPFRSQLKVYHRNRVLRIFNPQSDDYPRGAEYLRSARAGSGPIGGNAASFLTSF